MPAVADLEPRWTEHGAAWRDPGAVVAGWEAAGSPDPQLLRSRASAGWWDLLDRLGVTLLVTREYEHLMVALSVSGGRPLATHLRLPHPSGLAVDRDAGIVHVAATRNPNQVLDLAPVTGALPRADAAVGDSRARPLVPLRSRFLPGALYIHDLALVGQALYANSVGQNAVVELPPEGGHRLAWWPRAVEDANGQPDLSRNYLQLNSIASGASLRESFFSASSARRSHRRPGHRNYPVDGRGVLFSGATREPLAGGLTRPHSARLFQDAVWIDNSGYGELARLEGERFETVARLPGWTRGLCFAGGVAFVGTSRVIPRFRHYAPGLKVERSACGIHAVDIRSGEVVASLRWPYGNQIFAIEALPRDFTRGLPFHSGRQSAVRARRLFYAYDFQGDR
jgi:uncharacterized protein (TIGR03032 family)